MGSDATENLFLLEFLVDHLELAPQCDCAAPPGETCVAFSFLDNPPLEICEEDFTPAMKYGQDNGKLKSGKSCLFSLTSEQIEMLTSEFDVIVSVLKKMQPGWLPERLQVGSAIISVANLFAELIQGVEDSTAPESGPTSKTLKDAFEVMNTEGIQVGKIGVYIRMSCFGKLIVTQFQMNFDDKSVLFKDKEGKSLYRYKKAPKGKEHKIDDIGGGGKSECDAECPFAPCDLDENEDEGECAPNCPGIQKTAPCENKGTAISHVDVGVNPDVPPCIECMGKTDAPCTQNPPPGMGMGMGFPPPMGFPGMPGMGMPFPMMTPCNECGMLPEPPCIPPGMGGGFPGAGFPPGFPNSAGFPPQSGGFPGGGLMGCTPSCEGIRHLFEAQQPQQQEQPEQPAGNYQEIGATLGTNKLTIRVHKNSKIEPVEGNPNNETGSIASCTCCPGAQAARKDRKQNQGQGQAPQAYSMGPGVSKGDGTKLPFSFKMGCTGQGAGGGSNGKNVIVQPPTSVAADGTQFTEISDPDKDLFILRIGKKSEGMDKKNNLELELCTPRAPDYKPSPKQETRDTQFDENDLPEGGGKKGKGKKGKGGKKGKKGKK